MKIVICDGDILAARSTAALAEEYAASRSMPLETAVYTSGVELLRELPQADIYLLDIDMPDADGIALGARLRECRSDAFIFYMSSSREFALDAFSVHAFSYLLKPVDRQRLFEDLDACLAVGRHYCLLDIRQGDASVTETVAMEDVICVEYSDHSLIYRLADGRRLVTGYKRGSFESIAGAFHDSPSFLKISVSYLVNLRHIRALAGDEFVMDDGSAYRISRKFAEARKKYLDYILG